MDNNNKEYLLSRITVMLFQLDTKLTIKESDCPTDVFIENCVTEIKSYIHDFKMGNDNERPEQGVSTKPDNRPA